MNSTTKTSGPHNCERCTAIENYDGTMMCSNATYWDGGTPPNPECFEYSPDYLAAINLHLQLQEEFGDQHPDTVRARKLVMELNPPHIHAITNNRPRKPAGLLDSRGQLEDGTPLYRLDDVANWLGVSLQEVETAVAVMLDEVKSEGLPASNFVTNAAMTHRPQQGRL
jgi:hypothetical protein